jgi:hypothetical protein
MSVRRVVVRLSADEKRMLRELAAWNHTSMTEMVRRMIDEEYEARFRKKSVSKAGETVEDAPGSQGMEKNNG